MRSCSVVDIENPLTNMVVMFDVGWDLEMVSGIEGSWDGLCGSWGLVSGKVRRRRRRRLGWCIFVFVGDWGLRVFLGFSVFCCWFNNLFEFFLRFLFF